MAIGVKLRTKPRGLKRAGRPGERGQDMCPHCYAFNCDPMAMSPAFQAKINERLRKNLCPACGNPVEFCRCRSTISKEKAGRPIVHNNRKLRRARALVTAKEQASQTWDQHDDALSAVIGETRFVEISQALYQHKVPSTPWSVASAAAKTCGIDPARLQPGWQNPVGA